MNSEEMREPHNWTEYVDRGTRWQNIEMKEVVWSDLPAGVEDAIEDLIAVPNCRVRNLEAVNRLDPQTVEIVWFDDAGDSDTSKIEDRYIKNAQRVLGEMFGRHWRVRRKQDGRRWDGDHPQRAIVRRADHQRMKYNDESETEFKLALKERPSGVPDDVDKYGDLSQFENDPLMRRSHDARNVYVYESSTGTVHLAPDPRDKAVVESLAMHCGLEAQPAEVVDEVEHYADVLERERESSDSDSQFMRSDHDPKSVIGDDLCLACWKSYAESVKNGSKVVRYRPPAVQYRDLVDGRR